MSEVKLKYQYWSRVCTPSSKFNMLTSGYKIKMLKVQKVWLSITKHEHKDIEYCTEYPKVKCDPSFLNLQFLLSWHFSLQSVTFKLNDCGVVLIKAQNVVWRADLAQPKGDRSHQKPKSRMPKGFCWLIFQCPPSGSGKRDTICATAAIHCSY